MHHHLPGSAASNSLIAETKSSVSVIGCWLRTPQASFGLRRDGLGIVGVSTRRRWRSISVIRRNTAGKALVLAPADLAQGAELNHQLVMLGLDQSPQLCDLVGDRGSARGRPSTSPAPRSGGPIGLAQPSPAGRTQGTRSWKSSRLSTGIIPAVGGRGLECHCELALKVVQRLLVVSLVLVLIGGPPPGPRRHAS